MKKLILIIAILTSLASCTTTKYATNFKLVNKSTKQTFYTNEYAVTKTDTVKFVELKRNKAVKQEYSIAFNDLLIIKSK